jgi:serine/threonine protein kinase
MLLVLNYLHNRGYIHRDIKLDNMLLERRDELKIILADFGFVKDLNKPINTLDNCGTPGHLDPEVLKGG